MECPVCRRALESDAVVCVRCGAEVENLAKIEAVALRLILRGSELLRRAHGDEAYVAFASSLALRRSEKAARGAAAALLCSGRFSEALRARQNLAAAKNVA